MSLDLALGESAILAVPSATELLEKYLKLCMFGRMMTSDDWR